MKTPNLTEAATLILAGAICGDTIGSAYEFSPTKELDFALFTPLSSFTDDTVCSIALADSLISGRDYSHTLQHWCKKYLDAGYGGMFWQWINTENPIPYGSYGNGAAMRVSPIGAYGRNLDEVMCLAKKTAMVTHNHPEGIKGAQATATAIYYALHGMSKTEIKSFIEKGFGYDLSCDYFTIQQTYGFDETCQGSVPESILAFLAADSFESTIRYAVALGGDADTQAAIAGGIAAAYYKEIPDAILNEVLNRLPQDMLKILNAFNKTLIKRYGK